MKNDNVRLLPLMVIAAISVVSTTVEGFSTPTFGLGALIFQPKGLITTSSRGDVNTLLDASEFFVDAFWAGKVGGGAKELDQWQRKVRILIMWEEVVDLSDSFRWCWKLDH